MSAISVTAANVLASSSAAREAVIWGSASVTAGKSVYETPEGTWKLADANVQECYEANRHGVALSGGGTGQPGFVALRDSAFVAGATLTIGQTYCVGSTAGEIVPISDLTTGDAPIVLFVATTTSAAVLSPVSGRAVKGA